jgi:hypothetical protein
MKKMLNLILLILSHIGVFAQFDGTPFYFCTLSGEQYNPGKHNTFQTGNIFKVCWNLKTGLLLKKLSAL